MINKLITVLEYKHKAFLGNRKDQITSAKALEVEYNLNNNEIIQLLTKILHKYTNNGELKIYYF